MYPQRPSDSFFFQAMLHELMHLWNCRQQVRQHVVGGRILQRSSVRQQVAFRSGRLLLRCSQWLLDYSEGRDGLMRSPPPP
jgi:hypothetical protein